MKKNGIKWQVIGLACLLALGLGGCGKEGGSSEEPVAAEEGAMGSYQQELECSMGRRTLANPKFPEGDTYEDNAYTRYVAEKLNIRIRDEFEANGEDYDRQVFWLSPPGSCRTHFLLVQRIFWMRWLKMIWWKI